MKALMSQLASSICRSVWMLIGSIVLLSAVVHAQSSTTTARTPGSPVGSYKLGDADTVNLFTGNLSYNLPLLAVGGRGESQGSLGIVIEGQWDMRETDLGSAQGFLQHEYSFRSPNPLALVGSVKLEITSTQTNNPCGGANHESTYRVSMTYVEADGTEHALRDRVIHGIPVNVCAGGSQNVGNVFESPSGDFITFVTDTNIYTSCFGVSGCTNNIDGYLFFRNGVKARVSGGYISWIQDRNGNKIEYQYEVNPHDLNAKRLIKIIDSIGRKINIAYDAEEGVPYGRCTKITYKGFGGQDRVIRISHGFELRTTQTYDSMTRADIGDIEHDDPNDSIMLTGGGGTPDFVKAVWLPDGRSYQFKYNVLSQLARVELPTGGAIEYDYQDIFHIPYDPVPGPLGPVTNRVSEKRVYDTNNVLVSRTVFSTPSSYTSGVIPPSRGGVVRDVDLFDPSGNRLSRMRHYFYGMPSVDYGILVPFWHGKEFRTEIFDVDGTTMLRVAENEWRQRAPSWCSTIALCSFDPAERAPTNNPFVIESKTTLVDGNLVSKISAVNPDGTYAFDNFNNQTDVWTYDYGTGQPGTLIKHNHTSYINNLTTLGNILRSSLTDTTSDYSVDPDGQETLAASTQTIYDEYEQYPLLTYDTVTGWQNPDGARGNPTTVRRWLNTTNTWIDTHAQFDQTGNVRKSWDALGRLRETSYEDAFTDNLNRNTYSFATQASSPIPDGGNTHGSNATFTSSAVYDYSTGLIKQGTDITGQTTSFEYAGALDRLSQVINPPGGGSTTYTYSDAVGNLHVKTTTAFDETRNIESYSYFDGLGRGVRSFSVKDGGLWVVSDIVYDAAGRTLRVSKPYETSNAPSLNVEVNPANNWVTTQYDALGRVKSVTTADGSQSSISYQGATVTVTDAALRKRSAESDVLGRLKQVTEDPGGDNFITRYSYDILGNLRAVHQGPTAQPQQQQHRYYAYDSLSRLIRSRNLEQDSNPDLALKDSAGNDIDDPITGNNQWSTKIEYYANGDVSARTDARGIKIEYSYDALNRLYHETYTATRTLPNGTYTPSNAVDYYYDGRGLGLDQATIPQTFLGKTTRIRSSASETRFTGFDAMGRVTSSEQTTGSQTYQMPSYTYNYAGALVSQTYPSGRVMKNDYDDGGNFSALSGQTQGQAWKTYASNFDYSYTNTGATSRVKLGNDRWESIVYNKRLQPTHVGLGTTQNGTDLLKLEYDYGLAQHDNGNITSQTITVPTVDTSSGFTAVQTYDYDTLNRLTSAIETSAGQPSWQQTFTYDQFGNRSAVTSGANATTPALLGDNPVVSSATNRITPRVGEGYDYDAAGNLIKDRAGNIYSFDGDGMQATFTFSGTTQAAAQYFYDGEGHRVKKVSGDVTTVFVYNAFGQLVAEYASNAQASTNPTTYMTFDPLGTPRINTDASGGVVARHDYMPFGEDVGPYSGRAAHAEYRADTVRQKFAGYQYDAENDLDYAQARYYAPKGGRFTSVDPLTASASTTDPQSFNRYTYALNSPYRYTDSSGMGVEGDGWDADDYFAYANAMADDLEDQRQAARAAEREAQRKQQQQQEGQQQTGPQNSQQGEAPQQPLPAEQQETFPDIARNGGGLPDPQIRLDGPYIADMKLLEQDILDQASYGDGSCVPLVKSVSKLPQTAYWRAGVRVQDTADSQSLQLGTAIATFKEGHYPQGGKHGKHVGYFAGYVPGGFKIVDQWVSEKTGRQPVHERTIMYNPKVDKNYPANTGSQFYVIMTLPEQYRDQPQKSKKH